MNHTSHYTGLQVYLNNPPQQVIPHQPEYAHGSYEAPEDPAWPTPTNLQEAETLLEELPVYSRLICHATAAEMLFPIIVNFGHSIEFKPKRIGNYEHRIELEPMRIRNYEHGIEFRPIRVDVDLWSMKSDCISFPEDMEPLLEFIYESFFVVKAAPGRYLSCNERFSGPIVELNDALFGGTGFAADPKHAPIRNRMGTIGNVAGQLIDETENVLYNRPLHWTPPSDPYLSEYEYEREIGPPRSILDKSLEVITFGIEDPEARQEAISRFLIHWWTRCRCRLAFMDPNKAELQE